MTASRRPLPLNALQAFSAVYHAGGIRAASRELDVTHSSVSRHVRCLEERMGSPLILRLPGSSRLEFTAMGQQLGESSVRCLNELAETIASVEQAKVMRGVVIAATASLASRWLFPKMTLLKEAYSSVHISVKMETNDTNGNVFPADIGITNGASALSHPCCQPLMDDVLVPVASPGYAEKLHMQYPEEPLRGARLQHYGNAGGEWLLWREKHSLDWLDAEAGDYFPTEDLALEASANSLGVTLAHGRLVLSDIKRGRLARVGCDTGIPLPKAYWITQPAESFQHDAVLDIVTWIMQMANRESDDCNALSCI